MLNAETYTYHVIWSEEDKEYVGLCTEFPSLSWLDESPAEALSGIQKLVISICDKLSSYERPTQNN